MEVVREVVKELDREVVREVDGEVVVEVEVLVIRSSPVGFIVISCSGEDSR